MKHSSLYRSRAARSRRPLWYRPVIESLERRLPPGDLLWTLLLGGSELALDMEASGLELAEAKLGFEEEPQLVYAISRPAPAARGAPQTPLAMSR